MTNSAPDDTAASPAVNAPKLFYIKNVRSDDVTEMAGMPWEAQIPTRDTAGLPAGASKDDYKNWIANKSTDWCFFSGFEGLTPSLRVGNTNPAKYMHAFIGDYDGETSNIKSAIQRNAPAGLMPTAMSRTFSGGVRLVWLFEEPILVGHPDCLKAFLSEFVERTKANKIIACYDKASQREIQYFEIGNDWEVLSGNPIPTSTLYDIMVKATDKVDLGLDGPEMPMERVAAEVERLFPGRWKGPFDVGALGPLFWIPDGRDSVACKVRPQGMRCYSTRAPAEFVFWSDIFGPRFVQQYEEERIGSVCSKFWHDGKAFFIEEFGEWHRYGKDDLLGTAGILKIDFGLSTKGTKKNPNSEAELAYRAIAKTKRVDGFAPLLYRNEELVWYNGKKILNTRGRAPMKPAETGEESSFPWLAEYFGITGGHGGIWGLHECPKGFTQKEYFLAWLRRFYEGAINGLPVGGQVVFIAGPNDFGKTFLSSFIMREIAGGHTDPRKILLENADFNKEAGEVGAWSIDDLNGITDPKTRRKFSDAIKHVAASDSILYHPKYADAVKIPWLGRMMVTCNTDAMSLTSIPDMSGYIKDKVLLFKVGDGTWRPTFPPRHTLEAMVKAELPFFLRWLLNWTPPEEITKGASERFGVREFHHPDLVAHSRKLDGITHFREAMEEFRSDALVVEQGGWSGTAGQLLRQAADQIGRLCTSATGVGINLTQLIEGGQCPWLTAEERGANRTIYSIKPRDKKEGGL